MIRMTERMVASSNITINGLAHERDKTKNKEIREIQDQLIFVLTRFNNDIKQIIENSKEITGLTNE